MAMSPCSTVSQQELESMEGQILAVGQMREWRWTRRVEINKVIVIVQAKHTRGLPKLDTDETAS